MRKLIDILGQKFGRLTVVERAASRTGQARWKCICECGNQRVVASLDLRKGHTKSCGCFRRDVFTIHGHGKRGAPSRTYMAWQAMKNARCGARVCDRWLTFSNFLADMGERPAGLSLQRIDRHKLFEPGNAVWASRKMVGRRFGSLTVISRGPNRRGTPHWNCRCDCGTSVLVYAGHLRGGHSTSCGCYARTKAVIHGHSTDGKSPTYTTWTGMRARCLNPNYDKYKDYGGRGITICARWDSFENFLADMGPRPSGKTIDRYPDTNGNYEPGNCRWATPKEQMNNLRIHAERHA